MKPVCGKDFFPGDVLFTKSPQSTVSGIITHVLDALDDSAFDPSHVVIVQDDRWGIEAAEKGVRWCRLEEIFNGSKSYVIATPDWSEQVRTDIIRHALKYYGRPYDYTGLAVGFPLMLVTKLSNLLPPLKKIPVPLHLPGSFVCSAFVAQVLKDTGHFNNIKLLNEWHTTRITPAMLYRDFPWRKKYEYNAVSPPDKPVAGRDLTSDPGRPDNPYSGSDESNDVNVPDAYVGKGQGLARLDATAAAADDGWKSNAICSECTADCGRPQEAEGSARSYDPGA